MLMLGQWHTERQEHEQAIEWYTKGAEAGLPTAMYSLGFNLSSHDEGGAAPDYPAAAGWYRRAADAGDGSAAINLSVMYTIGRGRAWHQIPPHLFERGS
jgi:TPR repeat protein